MPDNAHYAPHGSWSKTGGRPVKSGHLRRSPSPRTACLDCGKEIALSRIEKHLAVDCIFAGRKQCSKCDQWFTPDNYRHHTDCAGPIRSLQGHNYCDCGKMKAKLARCCWDCEVREDGVFDRLDRLTRTGKYRNPITAHFAALEAADDNPRPE